MSSGAIAYLLLEGYLNDADAKTSPLVTAGWGEWFGVRWVVLHGMTTASFTPDGSEFVLGRRFKNAAKSRRFVVPTEVAKSYSRTWSPSR